MGEIRSFRPNEKDLLEQYIENYCFELPYIADSYNSMINKLSNVKTVFYGYFLNDEIHGVIMFDKSGVMSVHYDDDSFLGKASFASYFSQYKPTNLIGLAKHINPVFEIFRRKFKTYTITDAFLMTLNNNTYKKFIPYHQPTGYIVDKEKLEHGNLLKLNEFIEEVDREFDLRGYNLSQTTNRFNKDDAEKKHIIYIENDVIISQAKIQKNSPYFSMINGIYVKKEYRGKGIATLLMLVLIENILENGKSPILTVDSKNLRAINIYKAIGFYELNNFVYINLKY